MINQNLMDDMENSQPIHTTKNEKGGWKEDTESVAEQTFDKRDCRCNSRTSQQKPGPEIGIYQQRHCQVEQKGTKKLEQNEGRLSDFLDSP